MGRIVVERGGRVPRQCVWLNLFGGVCELSYFSWAVEGICICSNVVDD